jgi:DNA-binding NtrC family response regulator
MNIREVSSQFSVLIYTKNLNLGSAVKVNISRAGYEVFYLENENQIFQTLNESQPHVLILDLSSVTMLLSELIEKINIISPELKLIFLSQDEQFEVLSQYSEFNVHDIIPLSNKHIENRILWSLDKCCEMLFLSYKNEQIYSELVVAKKNQENVSMELAPKSHLSKGKSSHELIDSLKFAESKDDVIKIVFQSFSSIPCLFFKYIPSLNSFVLMQGLEL